MSDQLIQIADRIRDLREILEISVEEMASAAGLSTEEYIVQESGERDFSFTLLYSIANKLRVDISDLISGESPKLNIYSVTRKGGGEALNRRKEYTYEHLFHSFKARKSETFIVTVEYDPEKETPTALYNHEGQELNYILEGTLHLFVGDHDEILHEGDAILFDATRHHAMAAMNGKRAVFLCNVAR